MTDLPSVAAQDLPSATAQDLPRCAPSTVGVPAQAVEAVLDALDGHGLEMHSLIVVRHGRVAAEGWWAPYSPDRVHLLHSLSKSFTSSAVGFCVAEGRFRLEDVVVDLLPAHVPADVAPAVASLTVHHLLSMSTGHREDTLGRARASDPQDIVRGFLRIPPEEPVGSRHAYNNCTTYALATIVEERTGVPLLDYLRPRLLDPLGIGAARWDTDEHGQALGFTGLHLQTESVARFGQLLLQDGVWGGIPVLPEGWVALATRKHVDTDTDNDPAGPLDWRQGYGYQYWMARHGFRGDGAHGQFCVVVPEADLVVATTARVDDMQLVLDALWEHLLPALDRVSGGTDVAAPETRLRERLAALALPVIEAADDGPGEPVTFLVEAADPDDPFVPGTRVTVTPDAGDQLVTDQLVTDQLFTVQLFTVQLGRARLAFACGRDHWAEGTLGDGPGASRGSRGVPPLEPAPVVCRGGWTSPGTFEADLVLIETPHRIRLRGTGSRLEATWNVAPLSGGRIEVHLPW